MLDVHGGVDVDAGIEQLDDILPALGVSQAGRVRVRQLVDEDQRGTASERGIEIEFAQPGAAIVDRARRKNLEPLEQRVSLGPAMSLDISNERVDSVGFCSRTASSIAYVLPTPAAAPRNTFSFPRR